METDQRELRACGTPEDEIVHHLVERYNPTNREMRRVRHPLGEFLNNPENERMLLSEVFWREEKRQFNRTQRLNQEIAAVRIPTPTVYGKTRIVLRLHLVAGKKTDDALARLRAIKKGNEEKEKRLLDKRRRERHFRQSAKRLEELIEKRRRDFIRIHSIAAQQHNKRGKASV